MLPLPDPITATEWLYKLGKYVSSAAKKLNEKKRDDFLNYNISYLMSRYIEESPIKINIAYSEIYNWVDDLLLSENKIDKNISIKINDTRFQLNQSQELWSEISNEGFQKLKEAGRIKDNEPTIRLINFKKKQNGLLIEIQKARYFDQAKSNLILEWKYSQDKTTLNSILLNDYGKKLPPLYDERLANTFGIAALIYYANEKKWVPYLTKRIKKVAVEPGSIQCSASGVAKWSSSIEMPTFKNLFMEHMYYELYEEAGLGKNDILELVPIAFCREYLRGGKPQIFFVGITHLTREELFEKRKNAAATLQAIQGWSEIKKDTIFTSSDFIPTQRSLLKSIKKNKISNEAIMALHYGELYIKKHSDRLTKKINKK